MEQKLEDESYFRCYFCNSLLQNDLKESHMAVCLYVLEPCPFKCESYVQRNKKQQHMKLCRNNFMRSMPKLYDDNSSESTSSMPMANRIIRTLDRKAVRQDKSSYDYSNVQMELSRICSRLQTLEHSVRQIDNYYVMSKRQQDQICWIRGSQSELRKVIQKLECQSHAMLLWKDQMDSLMGQMKQQLCAYEKLKSENECCISNLDAKLATIDKVCADLNQLVQNFKNEQRLNRSIQLNLETRIDELKDSCTEENATVAALWGDQKAQTDCIAQNIKNLARSLEEQKLKHAAATFELKTVNQISTESAQKTEILEREFAKLKAEVAQLKCDLKNMDECNNNQMVNTERVPVGRLLWKITNFSDKMKEAQEADVVLRSPFFYTHEYGYRIRILLHLNGFKMWKGRNMLVALHVLKGEYDQLQNWPCQIEGNLILHDLHDRLNPKHVSKPIMAKRSQGGEPDEDPNDSQYIFIPHNILLQKNYVKDDTVFLEVNIKQNLNVKTTAL